MISDNYEPTKDSGGGKIFTFPWKAQNTEWVKLFEEDKTTGVQTPITSGFSTVLGAETGGTVTFVSDTSSDDWIIIARETPDTQETPYRTSSGFDSGVVEDEFDKRTSISQEQEDKIGRSLTFPLATDSSVSAILPVPVAGKAIKGASDGLSYELSEFDPDEQVELATTQADIATTQAGIATTKAQEASDSADDAADSAASINLPALSGATEDDILTVNAAKDGYDFTSKASQAEAEAGTDANKYMTPERTKQAIDALASSPDYIKVSDVKTSGTAGGTFTSGAWRTRDINTEDQDTGGHCSINANQITLDAGTYECDISTMVGKVNTVRARLQDVDNDITLSESLSVRNEQSASEQVTMALKIKDRFTLSAETTLEIQCYCGTTQTAQGFGSSTNFGSSEVYTVGQFRKVA